MRAIIAWCSRNSASNSLFWLITRNSLRGDEYLATNFARRRRRLFAHAGAAMHEEQRYPEQAQRGPGHDREGHADVDIAGAEKAVTERVDHVEDRVRVAQVLRPLGQQRDGIEHAAEIRERREYERRDPVDLVEVFRELRVDEAGEGEHDRREHDGREDHEGVMDGEACEDQ